MMVTRDGLGADKEDDSFIFIKLGPQHGGGGHACFLSSGGAYPTVTGNTNVAALSTVAITAAGLSSHW
jgi:hypothetical protein